MKNGENPLISVIVPVYNTAKYLRRCLASICAQSFKELEIICINDGSTDNSLKILEELATQDNRIIVINQENLGAGSARNTGLKRASAPYIGFVDSDDYIAPDMYEKMYTAMTQNNVDFVECGAEALYDYPVPDNKDSLENWFWAKYHGRVDDRTIFFYTSNELWKYLLKKELMEQYKLVFAAGFNSYEDSLFLRMYKVVARSGYYIDENLYFYTLYENSIMGKTRTKKFGVHVVECLARGEIFHNFLVKNNIFEQSKFFFWDFYADSIKSFYNWADQDTIKCYGPQTIKNFLDGKDISCLDGLVGENYNLIRAFVNLESEKLQDISFLVPRIGQGIKFKLKKVIKCLLPYGFVRLVQRHNIIFWGRMRRSFVKDIRLQDISLEYLLPYALIRLMKKRNITYQGMLELL
jgi:glycosyltransferase involved in cell wall biosynthesis